MINNTVTINHAIKIEKLNYAVYGIYVFIFASTPSL